MRVDADALLERLLRRAHAPLGVIDTRWACRAVERASDWHERRFALGTRLLARRGGSDGDSPAQTAWAPALGPVASREHGASQPVQVAPNSLPLPHAEPKAAPSGAGEGWGEGSPRQQGSSLAATLTPALSRTREREQPLAGRSAPTANDAPSWRLRRVPLDAIASKACAAVDAAPQDGLPPSAPAPRATSALPALRARAAAAPSAGRETSGALSGSVSGSNGQRTPPSQASATAARGAPVVREEHQSPAGAGLTQRPIAQASLAQATAVLPMTAHARRPAAAPSPPAAAPTTIAPPASPPNPDPAVTRRDVPMHQLVDRVARVVLRRLTSDLERRGGKPWR